MRVFKVFFLLMFSSLSFYSISAPKTLTIKYEPISEKAKSKLSKSSVSKMVSCSFESDDIADNRQNKQTVANMWSDSLNIDGVNQWLEEARSTFLSNIAIDNARVNVTISPKLTRLYSYPESMNILGVSALVVDYVVDGHVVDTRHYRGFYAKTNWAGGNGEYLTALNLSINDLMGKMYSDLNSVCSEIVKS